MMRTFIIETGESLTGPWQSVQKYRADIIGPEEPNEPGRIVRERANYNIFLCLIVFYCTLLLLGEPQDFQGFYASSRVS